MKDELMDEFINGNTNQDLNDFDHKLQPPQIPGSPQKDVDSDEDSKEQQLQERNVYMAERITNL
jgi:hypothetical protein